jgi:hypothetical protein
MPRKRRRNRPRPAAIAISILAGLLLAALSGWAFVQWKFGARLWWRLPVWVSVNGRYAREASVYRSGEGTILIDLRHAPTHADMDGGGYMVQPFWNRIYALGKGYYDIHRQWAVVHEMWMPSVDLTEYFQIAKIDPKLEMTSDHLSFTGLDRDEIVVHGSVLLPWPER